MNKIITRNWVNSKIKFFVNVESDDCLDYSRFSEYVDKWKYILVKEYGARHGVKFGFTVSVTDIRYVSLFFAVCELGMKFVVYQRPNKVNDLDNYKIRIFKPIDLMVYDSVNFNNELTGKFIQQYGKISFDIEIIDHYFHGKSIDSDEFKTIANIILATPSSELLLTTSSGTTAEPKIIKHTHEFFFDLCERNAVAMDFKETDQILHIRNLHHGSSLGVFFLPSLRKSVYHHSLNFEDTSIHKLITFATIKNISKMIVPYNSVIDNIVEILRSTETKLQELTIFNLSFIKSEWIPAVNQEYIAGIKSIFGCNETSGPIFLPGIDKHSTVDNFDARNMGTLLDDYYAVSLVDGILAVYLKTYDKSVSTNDNFLLTNNKYSYQGRTNLLRINDYEFNFVELQNFVKRYLKNIDHELVIDKEKEEIYLALFQEAPESIVNKINVKLARKYGNRLRISFCKYVDKQIFIYGIKLDFEEMRKFFRYWNT